MSNWKKLMKICNELVLCFIVSCGLVLIFNFMFEIKITDFSLLKREVLNIWYCSITVYIFYNGISFVLKNILDTLEDHYSKKSTINKGSSHMIVDDAAKKILEYNHKIDVVHEAGHALMSYLLDIENFNVNVSYNSPCVTVVTKNMDIHDLKKKNSNKLRRSCRRRVNIRNFSLWMHGFRNN